jgi:1-acyl-sn-glycerol-3-phosphate acyltransferase
MSNEERAYSIAYPRRRFQRGAVRLAGRLVLPLAFRLDIRGRENWPQSGPLIVVGNHVAVMEAVLMAVFTPWPAEMLASQDVPHERLSALAIRLYGGIDIRRGRVERAPLRQAIDVLKQNGIMAIFPEGGIWARGKMKPQTGVAWLSYRTGAPVLPIGFSGTLGALNAALRLKRPRLLMRIGQVLPPAMAEEGKPRKAWLQEYALRVLEAIKALVPADDPMHEGQVVEERFDLEVVVRTGDGSPVQIPDEVGVIHGAALGMLLHRPAVLKLFRTNLRLPTAPLERLQTRPAAEQIAVAAGAILDHLRDENPYLLIYRFGPREAEATHHGLRELLALARWAAAEGYGLELTPIRRYRSPATGEEVVQIEQGEFKAWR